MRTCKAGLIYFVLVFVAGFILGPIRVLWLVPRVGVRTAELVEAPLMLAVPPASSTRLVMGFAALALLLTMEIAVVVGLRRLTIGEYVAGRDPMAGAVYMILLALFTLTPLLMAWTERKPDG